MQYNKVSRTPQKALQLFCLNSKRKLAISFRPFACISSCLFSCAKWLTLWLWLWRWLLLRNWKDHFAKSWAQDAMRYFGVRSRTEWVDKLGESSRFSALAYFSDFRKSRTIHKHRTIMSLHAPKHKGDVFQSTDKGLFLWIHTHRYSSLMYSLGVKVLMVMKKGKDEPAVDGGNIYDFTNRTKDLKLFCPHSTNIQYHSAVTWKPLVADLISIWLSC